MEVETTSKERRTAQTNESSVLRRRTGGWQFRPMLYGLAAFFLIAGVVPAASQSDSQPGSKLVGIGAVGPAEQGWSVALSAGGNNAIVGRGRRQQAHWRGVDFHTEWRYLGPTR
jgi:hypothetical protein